MTEQFATLEATTADPYNTNALKVLLECGRLMAEINNAASSVNQIHIREDTVGKFSKLLNKCLDDALRSGDVSCVLPEGNSKFVFPQKEHQQRAKDAILEQVEKGINEVIRQASY